MMIIKRYNCSAPTGPQAHCGPGAGGGMLSGETFIGYRSFN